MVVLHVKHTDWYTYVYKHAAIAGRVGLQKWMICDPHKSSKCGWFVINVNWNLIYLVIHKVVISLYKAVSIMFSHGCSTTNKVVTTLSQPCCWVVTVSNPKVFQASYQLVTRLLLPLQTRLWQPCSMGETTMFFLYGHCFFLNLSDSFSFALLIWCSVLLFRFRSLARSRLDRSCSISTLARSFSITS